MNWVALMLEKGFMVLRPDSMMKMKQEQRIRTWLQFLETHVGIHVNSPEGL